jgi:hypothetical protein
MRIFMLFVAVSTIASAQEPAATLLKAFPCAEGYGACTPGGRGGKILVVTTLDDYLPGKETRIEGSLRAAVDTQGLRYILFRVSGTIQLKADLAVREPFVTIAGQTSPGGGICVRAANTALFEPYPQTQAGIDDKEAGTQEVVSARN